MDYKLSLFLAKLSTKGYNDIVISSNLTSKDIYQSIDLNNDNNFVDINLKTDDGLTFFEKLEEIKNLKKENLTRIINVKFKE